MGDHRRWRATVVATAADTTAVAASGESSSEIQEI